MLEHPNDHVWNVQSDSDRHRDDPARTLMDELGRGKYIGIWLVTLRT